MDLDYKKLYEQAQQELEFLRKEREALKHENYLLDWVRELQAKHLLEREKIIKSLGGKV